MYVSLQHPKLSVPADSAHLGNTEATFEQPRNSFVPKVMKVKIRHLCPSAEALEG